MTFSTLSSIFGWSGKDPELGQLEILVDQYLSNWDWENDIFGCLYPRFKRYNNGQLVFYIGVEFAKDIFYWKTIEKRIRNEIPLNFTKAEQSEHCCYLKCNDEKAIMQWLALLKLKNEL